MPTTDPTQPVRQRVNPWTLYPGQVVIFRNAGEGPDRVATILPRGPLGQCMVQLETGPTIAVNEGRELFDIDLPHER